MLNLGECFVAMNQLIKRICLLVWMCVCAYLGEVHGQCNGGVNMGTLVPTSGFQTVGCVMAGQYYTFNASAGTTYTFSFCQGGGSAPFSFDTYLTVLTGAGVPVAGAFNDNACFPTLAQVVWTAPTNGTYRILVSLPAPGCGSNGVCGTLAYRGVPPFGPGTTCLNPQVIGSLPYTLNGVTTCGAGDDYSSAMVCSSVYMDGDDYVFAYNSPGNECVNLAVTGTGNWVGLFVVRGCPNIASSVCVAKAESGAGNPSLSWVDLVAPGTYYFIVSTLPPPQCTPFNLAVTRCPTGRDCADPRMVTGLPYVESGTTCGFGDEYGSSACGSDGYMDGDDFVYAYTAAGPECIDVFLSNTLGWTGVFVLDGCPDGAGTNCIASRTSILGNPPLAGVSLPGAGTYYIVVSTDPAPQCTPFDIRVDTCQPPVPCGLNPPPDNICMGATDISGYSSFCGRTDTLAYTADIPGNLSGQFCATIENNHWFTFVADTTVVNFYFQVSECYFGDGIQARVFSTGDCMNFVAASTCLNPGMEGNGGITASGLVVGQRYYLMVDGYARDDCEYVVSWDGGPLPVEFGEVSARRSGAGVLVEWETYSETRSMGFYVERGRSVVKRGAGEMAWDVVGFVAGAGESRILQRYGLVDKGADGSAVWYRVREVDLEGYGHCSEWVGVKGEAAGNAVLGLAPNPGNGLVRLEYVLAEAGLVEVKVHDLQGRVVWVSGVERMDAGTHGLVVDLRGVGEGVYLCGVNLGGEVVWRRVVVSSQ